MTNPLPLPPYDLIVPVRLPPLVSLVGAPAVDGLWSEITPRLMPWRAKPKLKTEWRASGRPERIVWEK